MYTRVLIACPIYTPWAYFHIWMCTIVSDIGQYSHADMCDMSFIFIFTLTFIISHFEVLSMNDTETRLLAQHMGHKFNIHVEHYALQTQLLERGKVAKILCAIQNGKLSRPNEKKPTHADKTNPLLITNIHWSVHTHMGHGRWSWEALLNLYINHMRNLVKIKLTRSQLARGTPQG